MSGKKRVLIIKQRFEWMFDVVCVSVRSSRDETTLGKKYSVFNETITHYLIINDNGDHGYYRKEEFAEAR